jgi:tripartite-type tricarboxylate transporter receptor subunit TctC
MAAWTQALQRRDTGRDRHRGGADSDRLPRIGTVAALVRGGQLSLIEVTTEKRLPQFSDVPTVSESGSPGFFFQLMVCALAPVGAPKEIVARLNAEVLKATGDGEVRRKLEELGSAVRGSSAEELRVMTRDQLAKYARVIKEMGIANE